MFKDIQSGFTKFFTREKIIIFIALLILGYALFSYSDSKSRYFDNYEGGIEQPSKHISDFSGPSNSPQTPTPVTNLATTGGYMNKQVANPSDLLPQDKNSQWAALNPVAMSDGMVMTPPVTEAGYFQGIDTIGQTLRNPNMQLRSDPIIEKVDVGPWMNSTIEPDLARTPLELGYGGR